MRNLPLSLVCLALSAACMAQPNNWVQVQTKNSPPGRIGQGLAYDFLRGRTVLFGGMGTGVNRRNDTWEYDGKNWVQMKPKTVPPGRLNYSMAFHFARLRTVLFGGLGSAGYLADTWTWNGGNWTQMKPKNSPTPRGYFALAYDSARSRTVLFGGIGTGGGNLAETWEWDGNNWTQVNTTNSPPGRFGHGMAYDSARKRIVLFGGNSVATRLNDTWEYDGKNWGKVAPKTQPSPRPWFGMAYDSAKRRTVIFGGLLAEGTWEYDGLDWARTKPFAQPTGRFRWGNELMVYDGRRNRMVLFGGSSAGTNLIDTWEYVPSQFLIANPATISIATGGTQRFLLNGGPRNAQRLYWIFGSLSGTSPGVTLSSAIGPVKIPLNPDFWTDITVDYANRRFLANTNSRFDTFGRNLAWFNVPKITNTSVIGVRFYHAYLVYDAKNNFHMASNPVELMLVK